MQQLRPCQNTCAMVKLHKTTSKVPPSHAIQPFLLINLPSGTRLQFAIENGPLIVDLPIKNGDFPYLPSGKLT